jgi:hypothetical protein
MILKKKKILNWKLVTVVIFSLKQTKTDFKILIRWLLSEGLFRERVGFIILSLLTISVYLVNLRQEAIATTLLTLPFIGIFSIYFVIPWLKEKDKIIKFKELPESEIRIIIDSRILLSLLLLIIFQILGLLVTLGLNFLFSNNLSVLNIEGLVFFLISLFFYDIFIVVFINWIAISHGNFKKFFIHSAMKNRPDTAYDEIYGEIKKLSALTSGIGIFIFLNLYLVILVTLFPLVVIIYNPNQIYLLPFTYNIAELLKENLILGLSFIILFNVLFITLAYFLRKKSQKNLENFSEERITIPNELMEFVT